MGLDPRKRFAPSWWRTSPRSCAPPNSSSSTSRSTSAKAPCTPRCCRVCRGLQKTPLVAREDTRPLHHVDSCWRSRRRPEAMSPDVSRGIELSSLAGRRRRSTVVDESSPLAGVNLPEAARDFKEKLQNYTISLASTVSKAIPTAELAGEA